MSRLTLSLPLVAALYFAAGIRMPAQSSQLIYDDSLQNSWQDWSWCTRDLSNSRARSLRHEIHQRDLRLRGKP